MQGSDWQRRQGIVSKLDLEDRQPYWVPTWGVESSNVYSSWQSYTHQRSFSLQRFNGACIAYMHFLGAAAVLIYKICCWGPAITHPARNMPPPPAVVATMMCSCSDSVTDPPARYVWAWLIWYVCALRVRLNETQHLLLLRSSLDSDSQTSTHQSWIWVYWICCGAINKGSGTINCRGFQRFCFLNSFLDLSLCSH